MRYEYSYSNSVAELIFDKISSYCEQIQICGSVRRQKQDNGDIDMVIVIGDRNNLCKNLRDIGFKIYPTLAKKNGNDIPVSIYFSELRYFGSMVLHFTGSNDFNDVMRKKAKDLGMVLTQFGLFKDEKLVSARYERDMFTELGMEYIDPVDRN